MDIKEYFGVRSIKGQVQRIIASKTAEALKLFCDQSKEFSQTIEQTDKTFQDCLDSIAKGINKNGGELFARCYHRAEMDALRSEYEDKLKQLPQNEITDTKEVFKAYLSIAVDASKRLTEFIKANPDEFYKNKVKTLFETIIQEVK